MATPARTNGEILHLWLRLLGWQIEIDRDGAYTVGVGTHVQADGSTLRVGGLRPQSRGARAATVRAGHAGARAGLQQGPTPTQGGVAVPA